MSEHTPNIDQMRARFAYRFDAPDAYDPEWAAEFDRGIATHDRDVERRIYRDRIPGVVKRAQAAERERCAQIAVNLAWLYQSPVFSGEMVANSMLLECATTIRDVPTEQKADVHADHEFCDARLGCVPVEPQQKEGNHE